MVALTINISCGITLTVTPTLIGYFPKRTVERPDWLMGTCVEEVCSVSTCIAAEFDAGGGEPGPYDVVEVWRENHERDT